MTTNRSKRAVRQATQARAQATVKAILDAGARILAEGGWSAFNTNAISLRAGVSIGSVYEYFENKQALIDAIANDHLAAGEALLAEGVAMLANTTRTEDLIAALVEGAVMLHALDPHLHRALSSEVPLSLKVRERAERLRKGLTEHVSRWLSSRVAEPRIAAQLLVDTTDAVVHRWWTEDDGRLVQPDRLAIELRFMLGLYLRSLESHSCNDVRPAA
ncbi:MAG TPA: TetR/AcrR family transcriptional regulator [Quisquiliibacterium sp.]|nr:TetR/AcrR family transcriptional regulator [Quisquiliibacterium sp.]